MASRVLIVEDHELLGQSLALALSDEGMTAEVALGRTENAILAAATEFGPDLVLLDLQLEGEIGTSIHLIQPIVDMGAQVVMLTGVTDRLLLAECIEAGALAVAAKSQGFEELVGLVSAVSSGRTVMRSNERDELLSDLREHRRSQQARLEPFDRLTSREQAVLAALMQGKAAELIAEEAVVSVTTVRTQIRSVLLKLGVHSQLAAAALASQVGWEPSEEAQL